MPKIIHIGAVCVSLLIPLSWAFSAPSAKLASAVDRLMQAGSYTWTERFEGRQSLSGTSRKSVIAYGETIIGGYTSASLWGVPTVLFENQAAYKTSAGWRYSHDLTDRESEEVLRKIPALELRARARALPHERLQFLLVGVRSESNSPASVITAILDPRLLGGISIDSYLRGALDDGVRRTQKSTPDEKITLTVWIDQGVVSRFLVEFWRTVEQIGGPSGGIISEQKQHGYLTDISDIGRTRVHVDGEVEALFLPTRKRK
jgi:hypothetical protein